MKKTILTLTLVLAGGLSVLGASGCGDDSICENDQNCVLSGHKTYNHTCDKAGGCNYTCEGGATCHISCPSGSCNVTATDAAEVILDCAGNGCNLSCGTTPTCKIENCSSACTLDCGAATDCSNSCDATAGCTGNGGIDF